MGKEKMRKALSIALLGILLSGALYPQSARSGEVQHQNKVQPANHNGEVKDTQDTGRVPTTIQIEQPINQHTVADQPENKDKWYARPDWWIATFTAALFLATTGLWIFTAFMWLATRRIALGAETQAQDFKASIAEANRAATAMEGVAQSMATNTEQMVLSVATNREIATRQKLFGEIQTRAYISVLIGGATFQVRDKNLKFAASPLILNTGHTPAFKLKWRIAAGILPVPMPDDFRYPIPFNSKGSAILGPQQNGSMVAVVPDFVNDDMVQIIKRGERQSLYVWGTLRYEDIFGRLHRCTFAQQLYWTQSGPETQNWEIPEIIRGWHLNEHNRTN